MQNKTQNELKCNT